MKDVEALFREGKVHEADQLAQKYQEAHPDNPEIRFARAMIHQSVKAWPTAIELVGQAARVDSNNERYLVTLGNLLIESGRLESAEAAMRAALKRLPHSPAVAMALGISLLLQNKLDEAVERFEGLAKRFPDNIPARSNLAKCWLKMRDFDKAIEAFKAVHKLQPHVTELNQNVVRALCDAERFEEANEFLRGWVGAMPKSFDAWQTVARFYEEIYRPRDALEACERAMACDGSRAEALVQKGRLMAALGDPDGGLELVRAGLEAQPTLADGHLSYAMLLSAVSKWDEALSHAGRAAGLAPNDARVLLKVGSLHRSAERAGKSSLDIARDALVAAVRLDPFNEDAVGELFTVRRSLCDWDELDGLEQQILKFNESFCSWPFQMLSMEAVDRAGQFTAARHYMSGIKRNHAMRGWMPFEPLSAQSTERPTRLRIGYLSADLRSHATAFLAAEFLESHDHSRFEVFAYACGQDDGSEMRSRLLQAFDHFGTVDESMEDIALAHRIKEDRIDVLIDLNGYTTGTRIGVMALRPAPIQLTYLGYPGTTGADFVDYVITDEVVSPLAHASDFSEKFAYVSGSYQCNDSRRARPVAATRAEAGLPEGVFVFSSFNQHYKITRRVFEVWSEILHAVPNSVLWLLDGQAGAKANLRSQFEAHGLDASRLIFAPKLALEKHLSRLAQSDLALDTLPYNMHTTASDALWMGVPVITTPGETFASRVAASLLTAVGMPELITSDLDAYRDLAIALATDRQRYAALLEKLAVARDQSKLFDGKHFARDVESLYDQMWDRYAQGLAPDHLYSAKDGLA